MGRGRESGGRWAPRADRGGAVAGTDLQVMMLGSALMTGGAAPSGMRLLVERGHPGREALRHVIDVGEERGGLRAFGVEARMNGYRGRELGAGGLVALRGRRGQAASSPDPGAPERNAPRSSASCASSCTSCRKGSHNVRSPRRAAAAAASPARTAPREGSASCGGGPGRSGHRAALPGHPAPAAGHALTCRPARLGLRAAPRG